LLFHALFGLPKLLQKPLIQSIQISLESLPKAYLSGCRKEVAPDKAYDQFGNNKIKTLTSNF